MNRTPRYVSRTGRDGTTAGNFKIAVRYLRHNSSVLIGGIGMSPSSGLSRILQVLNKQQSTSPGKIRDTQKLDTSVDRKFPNDHDYASIFRKVTGRELSHSSSAKLYLLCRIYFTSNAVQTEAQYFMELGIQDINTSNEFVIQATPATRFRRPTDGTHWSARDHFFDKATAFRISATRSEKYYSHTNKSGGKIKTLGAKIFQ